MSILAKKNETDRLASLITDVNAALATARQAEQKLAMAGADLMKKVGAAAALTRGDRRARTSAESHVARLFERGGTVDLDKFERDLEDRPHLWGATRRALHRVEREHIIDGHWRVGGGPPEEDNLRRAAAGYSPDEANSLAAELSRGNLNAFHLAALGFRRVGVSHPRLFGTLTHEAEASEIEEALELIAAVAEVFRSSPVLLESGLEAYGVQRRPQVDPTGDLIDAAAAEHQRSKR